MSLSNWDTEQNVVRKALTMPKTQATVKVARTAVKDVGVLVLDQRLNHSDVAEVTIRLRNGSEIKVH
jgi:hypothetical protein